MDRIPFCRPDISGAEIEAVAEVLASGWITSGERTRRFEQALAKFLDVDHVVCLSSATAGMELLLRWWGVGPGDEVITTPYTYAATVNVILHCGARPVLVDTAPGAFEINAACIADAVSPATKAVIPVDFAGWPCNYRRIYFAVESARHRFRPANERQQALGRPLIMGDCAHSLGARYHGQRVPDSLDAAIYSFHAVKNLTTAEGGCIAFRALDGVFDQDVAAELACLALHGQNKDARAKFSGGGWEYDIMYPGYKCNMTDIQAALGLSQLSRYPDQLRHRRQLWEVYETAFRGREQLLRPPFSEEKRKGSYHFYPLRIAGYDEADRNHLICALEEQGIQANVHFKPLPLFTAFRNLFRSEHYPQALAMYRNEISLPVYPALQEQDVERVAATLLRLSGLG